MPYKRGTKYIGQVRRNGEQKDKVFNGKKEAQNWEAKMRMLSDEEWSGKTNTVCLIDWAEQYLDFVYGRFGAKTYDEKKSMFRRFFQEINPDSVVECVFQSIPDTHSI